MSHSSEDVPSGGFPRRQEPKGLITWVPDRIPRVTDDAAAHLPTLTCKPQHKHSEVAGGI